MYYILWRETELQDQLNVLAKVFQESNAILLALLSVVFNKILESEISKDFFCHPYLLKWSDNAMNELCYCD